MIYISTQFVLFYNFLSSAEPKANAGVQYATREDEHVRLCLFHGVDNALWLLLLLLLVDGATVATAATVVVALTTLS
jgi:hypothetical protein